MNCVTCFVPSALLLVLSSAGPFPVRLLSLPRLSSIATLLVEAGTAHAFARMAVAASELKLRLVTMHRHFRPSVAESVRWA